MPSFKETWAVHPWLRIDRATRVLVGQRLEHGPSEELDRALARVILKRREIEQAGWFN